MSTEDSCYSGASIAGAVIGTFLTTILLLAVSALLYRQWRRHKGKHLVLVTNPEIVEDAYAFDNPCFKDATPAVNRNHDVRPLSSASMVDERTPNTTKDSTRWSSPWSSLGLSSLNKNDRRRTLDDSYLGPKATRVSVVSLRSRDFTGLGFNVCGNMREGIFVKDLLHRGPASESGQIHPGDRIGSVKISFRSMVYEDALTILSYASPYDVELEVENGAGGAGSRPATLLKKTVGPSPSRICHPLYRSQSIPELSQANKTSAKRLFIADPNESLGSNYSTMNSTIKSSKSTPGSHTLERRHEESKMLNHHQQNHHKFGIKVLPALDGTVHRIENQNEHNTNLERRNSRKTSVDDEQMVEARIAKEAVNARKIDDFRETERHQKRDNSRGETTIGKLPVAENLSNVEKSAGNEISAINGYEKGERSKEDTGKSMEIVIIPTEVPTEVHNAAMAARRNRKNSMELLNAPRTSSTSSTTTASSSMLDSVDFADPKSPTKSKRKAPAPPIAPAEMTTDSPRTSEKSARKISTDEPIETITDYAESLSDYLGKIRDGSSLENDSTTGAKRISDENKVSRHKSDKDSDTDSEIHDSFTTIELKPADITIHHTPVPSVDDPADSTDGDDVYRKAASLGDLSRYENKSLATLERAQSLDMADAGTKKRKFVTPEDINESTEDLTKLDAVDTFDRRKLKKSNEWGTLEDAIWKKPGNDELDTRTRSNGTLERSKSAVEMKLTDSSSSSSENNDNIDSNGRLLPPEMPRDTSIELYNLPLSMQMTRDFISKEISFNPDENNSLARIVNNGKIVKSPRPEDIELEFEETLSSKDDDVQMANEFKVMRGKRSTSSIDEEFGKAIRYLDEQINETMNEKKSILGDEAESDGKSSTKIDYKSNSSDSIYAGREEAREEPMKKVTVVTGCPGCDRKFANHAHSCGISEPKNVSSESERPREVEKPMDNDRHSAEPTNEESLSAFKIGLTRFEPISSENRSKSVSPTVSRIERKLLRERGIEMEDEIGKKSASERPNDDDDDEEVYDFGSSITVNSKNMSSPIVDHRLNVSNVSVSSGENSEDSGLVGESGDFSDRRDSESRPPLPDTPMPGSGSPRKLTYITEIQVSPSQNKSPDRPEASSGRETTSVKPPRNETTANGKTPSKKPPVPPRRNDASKLQQRDSEPNGKQIVYVSEYKTTPGKIDNSSSNDGGAGNANRKFENWIFLGNDNAEQNPWGNGSSQPQQVTNIVVAPSDSKKAKQ